MLFPLHTTRNLHNSMTQTTQTDSSVTVKSSSISDALASLITVAGNVGAQYANMKLTQEQLKTVKSLRPEEREQFLERIGQGVSVKPQIHLDVNKAVLGTALTMTVVVAVLFYITRVRK